MNAVLAVIANGGRAIVVIYREKVEIQYFLILFIDSAKTLRRRPWPTPSAGFQGWGTLGQQNHAAGGENGYSCTLRPNLLVLP
jgi:hypothetical protein